MVRLATGTGAGAGAGTTGRCILSTVTYGDWHHLTPLPTKSKTELASYISHNPRELRESSRAEAVYVTPRCRSDHSASIH